MGKHELTPGQSLKEQKFMEAIKKKNAERERLPRGIFIEKLK